MVFFVSLEVWQQPHAMGRGAARQSSEIPGLCEQAGGIFSDMADGHMIRLEQLKPETAGLLGC